ncbi:MAG: TonB-dependent receptor, partial [Myxococcota bacterium]
TSVAFFFTSVRSSDNRRTWDGVTGFGEVGYRFTEEIMTYVKYTRGYKAGHFNPSKPTAAKVPGEGFADPETIDAFEWGLDFSTWAGRISGNAAVFFYDYKNYQVFRLNSTPVGVFRQIQNAKTARIYGAEMELTILPLDGIAPKSIDQLRLNLRGGWLESEYLEFSVTEERVLGGGPGVSVTIDNTGNPLISAPKLQASLSVVWPIELDRFGTIIPQYDLAWTDDVPFDPNEGRGQVDGRGESFYRPFQIGNQAYALHNVRLSYEPPGTSGTRVSGWCRNVTDERYTNFAVDLTTFAGLQLHFLGDPRTCGVDLRFNW